MLTRSRLALTTILAAAALGAPPALAVPAGPVDARGENAASLSAETPAAFDHRSPDARQPGRGGSVAQPVVVEVDEPASSGFDWTAAIIGLGAGLALAVLAGVGVTGARRGPRTV